MPVKQGPLPTVALLGAVVLVGVAVALVMCATEAESEPNDLYELKLVSQQHGARTVAVRADGVETVLLESTYNSTSRLYTNSILRLVGASLNVVSTVNDVNWYWTRAAFDPTSTEALLGGSQGTLWSYDGGVTTNVGGISYGTVYSIDWHPTDGYAFVGTNYGTVYRYEDFRTSQVVDFSYTVYDIDFAPNGSDAAFACYDYLYVYNLTRGDYETYDYIETDDMWYYLVYAVEYSRDSRYLYAAWDDGRGSNAIFRLRSRNWDRVANLGAVVDRMVFEVEGSFLLCVAKQSVIVIEGSFGRPLTDWTPGPNDGNVLDVAIDDNGFWFIFGNDVSIQKYVRKDDVVPWLKTPVPDASFNEDDAPGGLHLIDLLNYVTDDRMASKLRFEIDYQSDPGNLEAKLDGHYIDFIQKVPNWNGKAKFRIKVWDRGYDDRSLTPDDNFNHTNYFNVTVRPINDPISLMKVGDLVVGEDELVFFVSEGQLLELPLEVVDVDRDAPSFSFNRSLPSMKVVPPATAGDPHILWFQPRNKDVGELSINLSVSDGMGSTDWAHLVFHIKNVNNPPRLMGVKDMTVDEDSWLNFTIWAVDEDIEIGIDDRLLFDTNRTDGTGDDDLPNFGFAVDAENPTRIKVFFLPTNEDVGDVLVEFRVRDGFGATGTWDDVKSMKIKVVNTNDAPELTEVNGLPTEGLHVLPLQAVEDQQSVLSISAHDDDGDPLTYYITDSRFKLEHAPGATTAKVTFTPTNDDVGSMFVVLSVWDDHNTFDELLLNLSIENVNDPPLIQTFEAKVVGAQTQLAFTLWQDQEFVAPIVIVDVDSLAFTYSETERVFTISVDPSNPKRATFAWTPRQDDIGTLETTVSVDDGDGGRATLNLVLTVMNVNDPPSSTTVTQQNFESPVVLQATDATDVDGDELTYIWDFGDFTPAESGVGLTRVTHTYQGWGTFQVRVTVQDGNGGESVTTLDIIVQQTQEEPQPVEVEEGPVGLVLALTVVALAAAFAMMVMYMRRPRKGGGGGA